MEISLADILHIEDRTQYKPHYAEAYRFNEDEMLTIKSVLDRYSKYHNTAHANLVEVSAQRCAEVLGVKALPEDKFEFLRTVLRDYIVLTRS